MLSLAFGYDVFQELLDGAHQADTLAREKGHRKTPR
jgi:glucose-6-phosphate isomerase